MTSLNRASLFVASIVLTINTTASAQSKQLETALVAVVTDLHQYLQEQDRNVVCLGDFESSTEQKTDSAKNLIEEFLKERQIQVVGPDEADFRLCGTLNRHDGKYLSLMSLEICIQDNFRIDVATFRERIQIKDE